MKEEMRQSEQACCSFHHNLIVCLISWRYNPWWLYFHSPVAGFSLIVFEVS
jgi:hypothetical protein